MVESGGSTDSISTHLLCPQTDNYPSYFVPQTDNYPSCFDLPQTDNYPSYFDMAIGATGYIPSTIAPGPEIRPTPIKIDINLAGDRVINLD
jgi:hypothetical protein